MDLKRFDNQCVRITTVWGEVFEGIVTYDSAEYALSEYGRKEEALHLVPILFFKNDIENVESLEEVNGLYGHYSAKYGLLEEKCLQWGTDMIEEVFDSEDDIQIYRMLVYMQDHFQSLAEKTVPGMAPWRSGKSIAESDENKTEEGPVYLGELENMLRSLIKCNESAEVVEKAEELLTQVTARFS